MRLMWHIDREHTASPGRPLYGSGATLPLLARLRLPPFAAVWRIARQRTIGPERHPLLHEEAFKVTDPNIIAFHRTKFSGRSLRHGQFETPSFSTARGAASLPHIGKIVTASQYSIIVQTRLHTFSTRLPYKIRSPGVST